MKKKELKSKTEKVGELYKVYRKTISKWKNI